MAQYAIVDAVSVTPQVLAAAGSLSVPAATAAVAVQALAMVATPIAAVTATVHIAAVRVDQVIINESGPCPHWTALMDSANQPIRESPTGFVILVETH